MSSWWRPQLTPAVLRKSNYDLGSRADAVEAAVGDNFMRPTPLEQLPRPARVVEPYESSGKGVSVTHEWRMACARGRSNVVVYSLVVIGSQGHGVAAMPAPGGLDEPMVGQSDTTLSTLEV
jgi:hypothetical protein